VVVRPNKQSSDMGQLLGHFVSELIPPLSARLAHPAFPALRRRLVHGNLALQIPFAVRTSSATASAQARSSGVFLTFTRVPSLSRMMP
jgi:hypothetical protein